jgi:hypothetical protein
MIYASTPYPTPTTVYSPIMTLTCIYAMPEYTVQNYLAANRFNPNAQIHTGNPYLFLGNR